MRDKMATRMTRLAEERDSLVAIVGEATDEQSEDCSSIQGGLYIHRDRSVHKFRAGSR